MTDRLIRLTTALGVLMVAGVAAVISYQHAYELVTTHGETGLTEGCEEQCLKPVDLPGTGCTFPVTK